MKRNLAWACGGIVALVALIRLSVGGSPGRADQKEVRGPVPSARPAQVSSFSVSPGSNGSDKKWTPPVLASSKNRLADPDLPPPPRGSSAQEMEEYRQGLQAVQACRDPVTGQQIDLKTLRTDVLQRMKDRQETAKKRMEELEAQLKFEAQLQVTEHRQRLLDAGLDPSRVGPQLFPPPSVTPSTGPIPQADQKDPVNKP